MTYRNETIEGKTLNLDTNKFYGCTLINCALQYRGGGVTLDNCNLQGNSWFLLDAALRTLSVLHIAYVASGATGGEEFIAAIISRIKTGESTSPTVQ